MLIKNAGSLSTNAQIETKACWSLPGQFSLCGKQLPLASMEGLYKYMLDQDLKRHGVKPHRQ